MDKQETKSLAAKSAAELQKMRKEGREKLHALQLDLAAGKVKNRTALRELRKDLARIETVLTRQKHANAT
jgi:ribosomal protein L29